MYDVTTCHDYDGSKNVCTNWKPIWLLIIPNLCYLIIFQGLPLLKNLFKSFRCFQSALWELSFPQKKVHIYLCTTIYLHTPWHVFSVIHRGGAKGIGPSTLPCAKPSAAWRSAWVLHKPKPCTVGIIGHWPPWPPFQTLGGCPAACFKGLSNLKGMKWDEMGKKDIESYWIHEFDIYR